ncbi:Ppx/GppA family phosphatase [Paenibacillus barcinonensis]|uniref:Exopolyphosphatase/guanosine-5'-triphosphate, 3'-diphosphate pyrophosphatase n=1 Tax=Paenibacillus barcinonensis TaxID=198119 RepID=A0A2V4V6P8_PAEBA|nr:Ppx/GppA phosphatase family protein [Paenibacillus barcinonensis]PYE48209.1 exopolyphosphatase/guanosine-5'-triphosphate,3'-diphosphate pyrophosphatase [Paenibacillus barcinonensis]QKS56939.1 Ppx/GppA family phosphatase [Paenibacillus barcinonensis]
MTQHKTLGIVDIGSNSIRLVIYELHEEGAYRIIHEDKYAARLSGVVEPDGTIQRSSLNTAVTILRQFKATCESYQTVDIRAAATAAIRNAVNAAHIIEWLESETGLTIECVSGDREAYYGFLGVIQSIELTDGFVVDIGGGSTEITVFRNRERLHSVSLPIGAVNSHARYGGEDEWTEANEAALCSEVIAALQDQDWIREHPGLPLVGLGGTMRTLAKVEQKRIQYSLPITHHYEIGKDAMENIARSLPYMTSAQRKKVPGLAKDRADIIVPGVLILRTVFRLIQGDRYVVSGAGLRDGLLRDYLASGQPAAPDALKDSIRNFLHFGPPIPQKRLKHIYQDMLTLYTALQGAAPDAAEERILYTASMLHMAGKQINYFRYTQHSAYWIMNASIYGLSHRETILSAIAADYHPKKRTPQLIQKHEDILNDSDVQLAHRIGSLLRAAEAMNRAESIATMHAHKEKDSLQVMLTCTDEPLLELNGLEDAVKDVQEAWGVTLKHSIQQASKG